MPAHRLWIAAAAFGLTATACGPGDSATDTDLSSAPVAIGDGQPLDTADTADTASSVEPDTTEAAVDDTAEADAPDESDTAEPAPAPVDPATAAANANAAIDDLQGSDDVRLIEVLDVTTGNATSLAQAVNGDLPVLVWFWAPH